MNQQFTDTRVYTYIDELTGKEKQHKEKYTVVIRNNKVENVFNNVFNDYGSWGHSVTKNSDVFQYFSLKYNH